MTITMSLTAATLGATVTGVTLATLAAAEWAEIERAFHAAEESEGCSTDWSHPHVMHHERTCMRGGRATWRSGTTAACCTGRGRTTIGRHE